jgi:hypothetical protein
MDGEVEQVLIAALRGPSAIRPRAIVRYLGFDAEDALVLAEGVEI